MAELSEVYVIKTKTIKTISTGTLTGTGTAKSNGLILSAGGVPVFPQMMSSDVKAFKK